MYNLVMIKKFNTLQLGILFSLLNAFCLGVLGIVDKLGVSHSQSRLSFSSISLVASFLFSAAFTLLIYKNETVAELKKIQKKSLWLIFLVATFGSGIFIIMRFIGLSQSTGTFATLSQVIATCLTALLAFLFLKERLPRLFYVLFLIIIFATYLVSVGKFEVASIKYGDLFILAGTFFLAMANVISKSVVQKVNPILVTTIRFFFASVLMVLVTSIVFQHSISADLSVWAVLSGLLWAANITFFNLAIQRIGVTLATSILMIAPVVTLVLEHFILGTTFNTVQVIACAVVVMCGITIAWIRRKK